MIIQEHKSSSYAPRTYHNASQGCTLAVAVDFNTAGEKLTHKASKHGIVQVPFHMDYVVGARELYSLLKKKDCYVLNIAGLVVAEVLDIECVGTWPKGYKMRFEGGVE